MPTTPSLEQFNPGAAPGVEHEELALRPEGQGSAQICCIDYCSAEVRIQEVVDLPDFLGHHRPEWSAVRWIDVAGLSDMQAVHALATKYELHPLAVEDLLQTIQRPKAESYGGEESDLRARLFVVVRAMALEEGELASEQVSIFLGHTTVLTFRERPGGLWDPVRQRLQAKNSRLRANDASFLMYSLLDLIVDRWFPLLETFSDRAEDLEGEILEKPTRQSITAIHRFKRDLLQLHRVAWPMREVVAFLRREPHECMGENARTYMHDLHDHVVQIMDIVEILRENASDLTETYMSAASQRMNEIMKMLTLIGTIFIPLTFLAGVYGMNFRHFPELEQTWGYPAFWGICVALTVAMLLYFRRREWL